MLPELETTMERVCVIGSGPAGIFTLKALKALDGSRASVTCFEQRSTLGGMWHLGEGEERHSPMYEGLVINAPKEMMELPFYRFPPNLPSYPQRHVVLDHLRQFAERENLRKFIRFNCKVESVSFDKTRNVFVVRTSDESCASSISEFDYVIVASGYFAKPRDVTYPGQETFPGRIFHSRYFHSAEDFAGKRVLLSGGSFSGQDIGLKCVEAGAARVTVSTSRLNHFKYSLQGVELKPRVAEISSSTVQFSDGSSAEYDVIINCVGYLNDFPAMEADLKLHDTGTFFCPAYKQCVLPHYNRLFYIGMQQQIYTVPMFFLQATLAARVISGQLALPAINVQREAVEQDRQRAESVKDTFDAIKYQSEYMRNLGVITGVQLPDMTSSWLKWETDRRENLATYRNNNFQSFYPAE